MDLKSNNKDIGRSIHDWEASILNNDTVVFKNEEVFDKQVKIGDTIIIDSDVIFTVCDLYVASEGIQIVLYGALSFSIIVKYYIYDGVEIPSEARCYNIISQNVIILGDGAEIGDDIEEVYCRNKNGTASVSSTISKCYKLIGNIDNITGISPNKYTSMKAGDWIKIGGAMHLIIEGYDRYDKIFIMNGVKYKLYSSNNKYYIKKIEEENRYIYGYVTNTSIGLEEKYVFVNTSDVNIRDLKPGDTIVFASSNSTLGTNKLFVTSASSSSVTAICKDSFKTFSIENSTDYGYVIILY